MIEPERIIWRADLPGLLRCSSETVRRYISDGKLPRPDVALSLRARGWKVSTLRAAGLDLWEAPASQPTPAA